MPVKSLLVSLLAIFWLSAAQAGEAEVRSAQKTIAGQIEAFRAGDHGAAYGYAAPNIKRLFPTVERFMSMVVSGYQPVYRPQSYAFGKVEELSGTSIVQQVLLVGPDGRNYEAVYTLELQPDGTHRITGVSLRASNALST
ncbi:DUF4864 domain-containing protein [Aquibium sp. A9E412]|uniref:DUF4864 domain-containing protein n=1 Tax=Aquibium sp. A9E412 TaxID=2976767 RepID=UPI0025AF4A5A|nr:DUF4864 domain-containing protein [Aquibium sp. A9E412]MDN2568160.1 DUF4864 domain-containing protein [Aquibium sp. A9E412]